MFSLNLVNLYFLKKVKENEKRTKKKFDHIFHVKVLEIYSTTFYDIEMEISKV